jgi:hypothetical protein
MQVNKKVKDNPEVEEPARLLGDRYKTAGFSRHLLLYRQRLAKTIK